MTGFEVERGGRKEGGGRGGEWVPVQEGRRKKSESEVDCGLASPLGFWIINKDKEVDY